MRRAIGEGAERLELARSTLEDQSGNSTPLQRGARLFCLWRATISIKLSNHCLCNCSKLTPSNLQVEHPTTMPSRRRKRNPSHASDPMKKKSPSNVHPPGPPKKKQKTRKCVCNWEDVCHSAHRAFKDFAPENHPWNGNMICSKASDEPLSLSSTTIHQRWSQHFLV